MKVNMWATLVGALGSGPGIHPTSLGFTERGHPDSKQGKTASLSKKAARKRYQNASRKNRR